MTDEQITAELRLADLLEQIDDAIALLAGVMERIRISELMLANSERLIRKSAMRREIDA